ncbi:hypothetical protein FS837_012325 [Tulasnella sp. UAMH 9824]|nr:hypothetical protein FS837_012325 [Tulasnella sp. UAMH 9824]
MAIGALVSAPIAGQILETNGGLNFAAVGGYSGYILLSTSPTFTHLTSATIVMTELSPSSPPSPTIRPSSSHSVVEGGMPTSTGHTETMKDAVTADGIIDEKAQTREQPDSKSPEHGNNTGALGPPPDGGLRAWLVVTGVFCAGFCTFGFANAFGVFQAYYAKTIPEVTQFSIAWIGSLQYSLIFLPGLVAGHLSDIGYLRPMLIIASAVMVTSIFLVAECKTLWQLVLCQGLAIGGASGFLFTPCLGVLPQYFVKKRATAYGCTALGSSLGGTLFPIVLRKLMAAVGFKWTIRILGFIIMAFLGVMLLCVRPRTEIRNKRGRFPLKELIEKPTIMLYIAAVSIMWLGIYNPLTYFDVYAQEKLGIPANRSYYVIVTANAVSIVGRIGCGVLADKFGPLNVQTAFCAGAAFLTIAWPYTRRFASLEIVAALYGICSGVFVSLLPAPSSNMVPSHQIGASIGLASTCMALFAVFSAPIAGQILDTGDGLNFVAVGGYSGAMVLFACCFSLASRYSALKGWKGKF